MIFMVDPTRKWTLEYVKQKLGEVPQTVDTLILVCFSSFALFISTPLSLIGDVYEQL